MALALRERLGDDGSPALADFVEAYGDSWKDAMTTDWTKQLDVRLQTLVTKDEFADFRLGLRDEFSQLRKELGNQRVELIRWCFLFWIGQVAATAGLISLSLRFAR